MPPLECLEVSWGMNDVSDAISLAHLACGIDGLFWGGSEILIYDYTWRLLSMFIAFRYHCF